jgi:hypothetical protein
VSDVTGLPPYGELPVVPSAPKGSSWGVWGTDDELGTLNLLNDARTLGAVRCVEQGRVFPLQLPLEEPAPGIVWRTRPVHHIVRGPDEGCADRDDYLDGLWLQGSSQWDGLTHVRHPEYGNYNAVPDTDIHGGPGTRLGIDKWATRAIVGRAVLVDVARWRPVDLEAADEITADELDACLN